MKDESLELGVLSRIGRFYEVAINEAQITTVNATRPPRVINQAVQDWRCRRRPDNPFTSDPRQTICLSPTFYRSDYEIQRRNS